MLSVAAIRRRRRIIPSSGEFTPIDAGGAQLWLSAREGITLTGSDVSGWVDQSSNGHVVTPVSTPPYTAVNALFNNKPTVGFTGAGAEHLIIDTAAATLGGEDTPFVWMNVLASITNFGGTYVWNCVGRDSTSEYHFLGSASPSGNVRVDRDDAGTTATTIEGTPASSLATAYIYIMRFNGTTVDVWRNGVKLTGLDGAALNKTSLTLNKYTIGAFRRTTVSNHAIFELAEHALFTPVPTLTKLDQLQKQWASIYGISVATLA